MSDAEELAEIEGERDEQVLEREPLEQELMQSGESETGERLDDVHTERKGE